MRGAVDFWDSSVFLQDSMNSWAVALKEPGSLVGVLEPFPHYLVLSAEISLSRLQFPRLDLLRECSRSGPQDKPQTGLSALPLHVGQSGHLYLGGRHRVGRLLRQ